MPSSSSSSLACALTVLITATAAGAAPQGSWSASGPEGAGAGSITVDPTDPSRVYAIVLGPRPLYLSTDGGVTWRASGLGLPASGVRPLAVAPGDPQRVYAPVAVAGPFDIVYRSDDGGETLASVGTASDPLDVLELVVDPSDPDTVYMMGQPATFDAGHHGLLRSTDGGATWSGHGFVDMSVIALTFDAVDSDRLYALAGGWGDLFRSTDGGATWEDLTSSSLDPVESVASFVATTTSPQALVIGTYDPLTEPPRRIHRSTDDGATWQPADISAVVATNENDSSYPARLVELTGSPGTLFGSEWFGGGLFRSTDSGASWDYVSWTYPMEPPSFDLATVPGRLLAASFHHGVLRSSDLGATWTRGTGFRSARIITLAIDPTDTSRLWATSGSIVHATSDGGATWQEVGRTENGRPVVSLDADPGSPDTLVATGGAIRRSTDAGASWVDVLAAPADDSTAYTSAVRDPHDASHLLSVAVNRSGNDGLVRSTDGGLTWTPTSAPADGIYRVHFDPVVPGREFVVSGGTLYRRDGPTSSWEGIDLESAEGIFPIFEMVVDPRDGSLYGSNGDMPGTTYRSIDAGETWTEATPLDDFVTAWLADGEHVYAATYASGVFFTDDGGATWTPLAGGQALPGVAALVSAPGVLYAATGGSGVVRLTADDVLFADGFESGDTTVWSADF